MAEQNIKISTRQRFSDWQAFVVLPRRDDVWEAGPTEEKAVERLRAAHPELLADAPVESE